MTAHCKECSAAAAREPDQIPDGWWFYDGENRNYPGPGNRTDPFFYHIEPGCTWEHGVTRKYDNSAFFAVWIGRSKEFPQGDRPYQFDCEHYAPFQRLYKVVCREFWYHADEDRKWPKIDRYYCSTECASVKHREIRFEADEMKASYAEARKRKEGLRW